MTPRGSYELDVVCDGGAILRCICETGAIPANKVQNRGGDFKTFI